MAFTTKLLAAALLCCEQYTLRHLHTERPALFKNAMHDNWDALYIWTTNETIKMNLN